MLSSNNILDDLQLGSSIEISAKLNKILNQAVTVVSIFIVIWSLSILFNFIQVLWYFSHWSRSSLTYQIGYIGFSIYLITLFVKLHHRIKTFITQNTVNNYRALKLVISIFLQRLAIVIIIKVLVTYLWF